MPLSRYGVVRGTVAGVYRERQEERPHYQIHVLGGSTAFRVAINVENQRPLSELLFLVDDDFRHPVITALPPLQPGFTRLRPRPGSIALDYVRGELLRRGEMRPLPGNLAGPNNDLSDLLADYTGRATADPRAEIFAFGDRWGPERNPDRIFGFSPGNGLHDIHMNQGNSAEYRNDDGTWQDGGLIFRFPREERWAAIFLAFQSQSWHTDDRSGHARGRRREP
jgi:uncharacterized protein YukJ